MPCQDHQGEYERRQAMLNIDKLIAEKKHGEAMLEEACRIIGEFKLEAHLSGELREWAAKRRTRDDLRASGLAKLTTEERKALGIPSTG